MVKDFLDATNGPTNETDIGFYVGWIASSFSLAQFFTSSKHFFNNQIPEYIFYSVLGMDIW